MFFRPSILTFICIFHFFFSACLSTLASDFWLSFLVSDWRRTSTLSRSITQQFCFLNLCFLSKFGEPKPWLLLLLPPLHPHRAHLLLLRATNAARKLEIDWTRTESHFRLGLTRLSIFEHFLPHCSLKTHLFVIDFWLWAISLAAMATHIDCLVVTLARTACQNWDGETIKRSVDALEANWDFWLGDSVTKLKRCCSGLVLKSAPLRVRNCR